MGNRGRSGYDNRCCGRCDIRQGTEKACEQTVVMYSSWTYCRERRTGLIVLVGLDGRVRSGHLRSLVKRRYVSGPLFQSAMPGGIVNCARYVLVRSWMSTTPS